MSENREGDFYIAEDQCVFMHCCGGHGPSLFQCSDKASYVKKQPDNDAELAQMFRASRDCVMDCILYRGNDKLLKKYFLAINSCAETVSYTHLTLPTILLV